MSEHRERLSHVEATLASITAAWPRIAIEIKARIDDKTLKLIGENNEQTRGAIKALRELLNLPEMLQQERSDITAALSDEDAAHN